MPASTVEGVRKELEAARNRANVAKSPSERIAALNQVRAWTERSRRLELAHVAKTIRTAKIDEKKQRGARSHFLFVVAGELFRRAKTDATVRSAIASLVDSISNPKEKAKAKKFLELYQAEWVKSAPSAAKSGQAAGSGPAPTRR